MKWDSSFDGKKERKYVLVREQSEPKNEVWQMHCPCAVHEPWPLHSLGHTNKRHKEIRQRIFLQFWQELKMLDSINTLNSKQRMETYSKNNDQHVDNWDWNVIQMRDIEEQDNHKCPKSSLGNWIDMSSLMKKVHIGMSRS